MKHHNIDLQRSLIIQIDLIANYYHQLSLDNFNRIGIYDGMSGICVFLGRHYKLTKSAESLKTIDSLIQKSISLIYERNHLVNMSFSSGLAGWCETIYYLVESEILDLEYLKLLDKMDKLLLMELEYQVQKNSLDQLNGAIGIARYLKRRDVNISILLDKLNETKIENKTEVYWYNRTLPNSQREFVDFGLAHGMVGLIYYLNKVNNLQIMKNRICIKKQVRFLIRRIQEFDDVGSFFPSKSTNLGRGTNEKSRMAWCYGDLSTFYILLKYSIEINDLTLKKFCLKAIKKIAKRKSFEDTKVVDANFCHGSSGIAYLFYKIWGLTKREIDFDAAYYWLKVTLDYGKKDGGYKFLIGNFEDRDYTHCDGLLEGLPGVALILMAFYNNQCYNDWDGIFMLD